MLSVALQKQKAAATGAPALQTDRTRLAYRREERGSPEGAAFRAAFGEDGQHAANAFGGKLRQFLGGANAQRLPAEQLPDAPDYEVGTQDTCHTTPWSTSPL